MLGIWEMVQGGYTFRFSRNGYGNISGFRLFPKIVFFSKPMGTRHPRFYPRFWILPKILFFFITDFHSPCRPPEKFTLKILSKIYFFLINFFFKTYANQTPGFIPGFGFFQKIIFFQNLWESDLVSLRNHSL